MSRLSDYSKFDHLIVDSDNEEDKEDIKGNTKRNNNNNNDPTLSLNYHNNDTNSHHQHQHTIQQHQHQHQHQYQQQHQQQENVVTKVTTTIVSSGRYVTSNKRSRAGGNSSTSNRTVFIFEYNGQPIYEWEQGLSDVVLAVPGPTPPATPPPSSSSSSRALILSASDIVCTIMPTRIQLGLKKSTNYFIDERTFEKIDVHESTWTLEEEEEEEEEVDEVEKVGNNNNNSNNNQEEKKKARKPKKSRQVIVLYLQKVAKGIVWPYVLKSDRTTGTDSSNNNNNNNNNSNIHESPTTVTELDLFQLEKVTQSIMKERWQEENPSMDFSDATFNGSVPDPRTFMGGVRYE